MSNAGGRDSVELTSSRSARVASAAGYLTENKRWISMGYADSHCQALVQQTGLLRWQHLASVHPIGILGHLTFVEISSTY